MKTSFRAWLALTVAPLTAFTIGSADASPLAEPECAADTPELCLNGVSSGVTGGDNMRAAALSITANRPTEVEDDERRASRHSFGVSAGDAGLRWGLWASAAYSDFEGTPVFGTAITRFDGRLYNGLVGADVTFAERFTLGVALGYESSNSDTAFNAGSIDADGGTVAPYAVLILNDYVSIDGAFGLSSLDNEQSRLDPASSTPGNPVYTRAEFDSSRWFYTANVNLSRTMGRWTVGGQVGLLRTSEEQDAYAETGGATARNVGERRMTLTEGHLSASAGYSLGAWEPYARVSYHRDFSRDDGQAVGGLPGASIRTDFDDDAWRLAAGVRYFAPSFSAGLEVETEQGRRDLDTTSVLMSIRGDF